MSRNQKRRFSEIAERPSPQDDAIRTALPHSFEIPSDPIIFLVSDSLAQNELLIHGANGVKLQSSEKVKPRQPSPKRPSSVSISAHTEAFLESQSPPRKRLKPTTALSPDLVTAEQSNALTSADSAWEGDQGVLYWQENEIVGYYSDDPEDDGEGVNGIGYRQTAAQKLASARRRQAQLQEWKLREAADDRAKRGERRRGAGQADAAIPSGGRESDSRKVRFS